MEQGLSLMLSSSHGLMPSPPPWEDLFPTSTTSFRVIYLVPCSFRILFCAHWPITAYLMSCEAMLWHFSHHFIRMGFHIHWSRGLLDMEKYNHVIGSSCPQEVINVFILCYAYWALSHNMIKQKDSSDIFLSIFLVTFLKSLSFIWAAEFKNNISYRNIRDFLQITKRFLKTVNSTVCFGIFLTRLEVFLGAIT